MKKLIGAKPSIVLDIRNQRKDATYAVKLRITYQRISKYYPIGINLSKEEWDRVRGEKPKNEIREIKIFLSEIEVKANKIVNSLQPFTFEAFEKVFNKQTDLTKDVFNMFDEYIAELRKNKQHGTADSYGNAKSSFQRFAQSKNRQKLNFGDITPEFLNKYEEWMLSEERSITTVGIYCRCLRKILNNAIEQGLFNQEFYPFGKRRFQIPGGRNIKKALNLDEIKLIYNYIPENEIGRASCRERV